LLGGAWNLTGTPVKNFKKEDKRSIMRGESGGLFRGYTRVEPSRGIDYRIIKQVRNVASVQGGEKKELTGMGFTT